MDITQIIDAVFTGQDQLARIILVILIAMYVFFALILTFQIRSLNKIINQVNFSPIFSLIAYIYLGATIALLLLAVIFL